MSWYAEITFTFVQSFLPPRCHIGCCSKWSIHPLGIIEESRESGCCLDRRLVRFWNTASEAQLLQRHSSDSQSSGRTIWHRRVIRFERQQSAILALGVYPCQKNKASMRHKGKRPRVLDNNKYLLFIYASCLFSRWILACATCDDYRNVEHGITTAIHLQVRILLYLYINFWCY